MAFKRASLSGSAQLFQPTRVPARDRGAVEAEPGLSRPETVLPLNSADEELREPTGTVLVSEVTSAHSPQGHLYRLSDDEVEVLLGALQHAKFPHSYQRLPKPALEEFEQLEALRQKISDQREAGG